MSHGSFETIPLGSGGQHPAAAQPQSAETQTINNNLQTLDEPVSKTILRDVYSIGRKVKIVLFPRPSSKNELRNWDLWGPFILCLLLATILGVASDSSQRASVFAGVFVIVWAGAAVVTINGQLLGGTISFFQSVCVLGYCLFPMCIAALLSAFIPILIVRLFIACGAFAWSTFASYAFLSTVVPANRKALSTYPMFLFYIFLNWMIIVN